MTKRYREGLTALAMVCIAGTVSAQDVSAETAIKEAFDECRDWVQTGDDSFAAHWWAIVDDAPFQNRRTSILISNQVPLYLLVETTYADSADLQSDVQQRSCKVRQADTAQPVFNWVNGAVSVGDHWSNLASLSPALVREQLDSLRTELEAEPTIALLGDGSRANAFLAECEGEGAVSFAVLPEWRLAGFGEWELTALFRVEPATPDSQVAQACAAR